MGRFSELKSRIEKNSFNYASILLVILLIIVVVNVFYAFSTNSVLKEKVSEIKEFKRAAEIELVVINCDGCSDVAAIIENIKSKNVNVNKEEILNKNNDRAKSLIGAYSINKLPSVLVFGEVNKININNFALKDDALVLSKVNAPYFELNDNEIKGEVSLISIKDSSCEKCADLNSLGFGFIEAGVSIKDWKTFEYDSLEAKEFIDKFKLDKVPSVLISEDVDYYEEVKQGLTQLGAVNKQGYYILHSLIPPYRDLSKNEIVGLVRLVMIKDKSCSECYDVSVNKDILARLGVAIADEKEYDITSADGKNYISNYDIKKVPMILLSPEAKEYVNFVSAWENVGSLEKDGWFVMREPENLGKVKNLETGNIIGGA